MHYREEHNSDSTAGTYARIGISMKYDLLFISERGVKNQPCVHFLARAVPGRDDDREEPRGIEPLSPARFFIRTLRKRLVSRRDYIVAEK